MTEAELKNITVEKNNDATVTLSGEIPFEYVERHRQAALRHLGSQVSIDGFRKGNIPEKVLVDRIGEMTLLSDMAERALAAIYPKIVAAHNLEVIGYPQISITKLAAGNPLGFRASVAVMPAISLPDYRALARELNATRESAEVNDEDVEKQIGEILRQKAAYERMQQKAASKQEEATDDVTKLPTPDTVANDNDADLAIPALTDELVQTLGQPGQFSNVTDFKSKIREHLEIEKKQEAQSRHRARITDAILEKTVVTIPTVMIEAELGQMLAQMEEDLKRAQLSMDDYLSHSKKSADDLKREWRPSAEKRAKLQLVLNQIAEAEDIDADEQELNEQVSKLMEQYKDADEKRVRVYIASVLQNEAVMKMLESS